MTSPHGIAARGIKEILDGPWCAAIACIRNMSPNFADVCLKCAKPQNRSGCTRKYQYIRRL